MKANITLKLDATLFSEIQAIADEEGTSISALLAASSNESCGIERLTSERESAP
ncbi:MAG: hypothetical protein WBQ10_22180 [Terriglobales bacterium]